MNHATRWLLRALLLVLVFESAGCAWLRHRRDGRGADAEIAIVNTAQAERRAAQAEADTRVAGAAADAATVAPEASSSIPAAMSAALPPANPAAMPAAVAPAVAPAMPAAVPGLSNADIAAARALAADFHQMHARFAGRGLPDLAAMNAYNAFLCPALSASLAEARAKQAAFIVAHPGDKPPLAEGDLFTSLFEGADSAKALDVVADGEGARVTVALARGVGPGATRWRDELVLQRDGGIWCVADVAYGGSWPFANKGRLGDMLRAAF